MLLRGTKLCIPETLQKHVFQLAHEGHQGQVKCKALLRETLWFPFMDKLVDKTCRDCIPCQAFSSKTIPDPIKPTELQKQPFSDISVDFCGPFTSGHYYMVILDDYSRFPVVKKLSNLTAKTVIRRLEKFFGLFRNTPHRALGLSPSEIVFNRKLKTKLPQFSVQPSYKSKDNETKSIN